LGVLFYWDYKSKIMEVCVKRITRECGNCGRNVEKPCPFTVFTPKPPEGGLAHIAVQKHLLPFRGGREGHIFNISPIFPTFAGF
jgi:hypothetical protein